MGDVDSDLITMYVNLDDLVIGDERVEVDPEAMDGLIASIDTVGLLQPIVVVKEQSKRHGEEELIDRYHVVSGRRRIRAVRALGWNAIPATVRELGSVARKLSTISENLHRQELPQSERDEAIKEFTDYYVILNPDWEERTRRRRQAAFMGRPLPPEPEPVVHPYTAASKAFSVDRRSVKRAVKRVKVLDAQQRKVLEVAKVGEADLDHLCTLDPETIRSIVNLVAAGFSFAESMRDLGALEAELVETKETVTDMLAMLPARRTIIDPEAFDADVAVWKEIQPHLERFKRAIGWNKMKATTGKGPYGLCYRRWLLAIDMLHPRSWTTCRCQLSGKRDPSTIQNCPICRGGGYQIGK